MKKEDNETEHEKSVTELKDKNQNKCEPTKTTKLNVMKTVKRRQMIF